jgi:serine/threonine-protein kinase
MGSVWLAQRSDGRFEREVAIKFLNLALARSAGEERFRREGTILARLTHRHIAQLIDAGVSATGQPYLVLEYVDGNHIDDYCDQHQFGVGARVRLFLDVLEAVAHAHSNLVVHRDIKPSNVLVRADAELKLLDFGIAKLLEDGSGTVGDTLLTVEGTQLMTPEYAAPEQVQGDAVTTGTDVYALGVLLYVLLTGRHLVGNFCRSLAETIKAVVEREPTRPSDAVMQNGRDAEINVASAKHRATTPEKLSRLLRGDLDNIITKALKKNVSERYTAPICNSARWRAPG